jgi:hypothetical protein
VSRRRETTASTPVKALKGFDDYSVSLGDLLRGERATLGKSLLDVQRDLKIKAAFIAAIENGDSSVFESPGFVAGYVRSYARYLGLDPEWTYEKFCIESGFSYTPGGLSEQSNPSKKKSKRAAGQSAPRADIHDPLAKPSVAFLPPGEARFSGIEPKAVGSMLVLFALVGVIGYGGWSVLQEVQKVQFTPVEQTPGVLSQLDPVNSVVEPAIDDVGVDIARPAPEAFDRLYRPQGLDVPVLTPRDNAIATIEPGSLGVLSIDPPQTDVSDFVDLELPGEEIPDLAAVTPQVVEDGPPTVELFAVRPSWVRVRAADGTIVFEKILDAGERFEIPATEEAHSLRAGNAGSVYFVVGQETYGPAGNGASVVRDVVLAAEAVLEIYAPANPDSDADLARFEAVAEAAQGE